MRTIKLTIEYLGTHYAGWQIQPRRATVQGTIQDILRRITQEDVSLVGASRTDSGVHALGQVAHFRTVSSLSCTQIQTALNGLLPKDISIEKVSEAAVGFHAIRSARKKTYRYLIWNRRSHSGLLKDRAWHVWAPLDLKAMRTAARFLIGRHDFSAFRAHLSDTKTSVRRIDRIVIASDDRIIAINIAGNGFLKYMVRNIVGTLVDVGKGRFGAEDVKRILRSKDRKKAGATAPAFGLYLKRVDY